MKKYLISQLTQISAWIGLLLVVSAFLVPRSWILVFGILLIITDDEALKGWVAKRAPWLTKKIEEISEGL